MEEITEEGGITKFQSPFRVIVTWSPPLNIISKPEILGPGVILIGLLVTRYQRKNLIRNISAVFIPYADIA
jgi:hypothetical protein